MTRSPRNKHRSGFTLIELTIAMAMVALLAISLFTSIRIAFRATESAGNAVAPPRTAALAMEFLRDDIQNAQAVSGMLGGNFEGTQSQGANGQEADDLIFYSTSDAADHADANGEIKEIELTIEPTPDGKDQQLVRRVTRNLLSQNPETPDEEVLCRGVYSYALQYYTGSQWQPTWDSTQEDNTIPAAVQVTLQLQRATNSGGTAVQTYTRIFNLSCSTAATDDTVNTGDTMQ
jgi:type II secretion system protein J